MPDHEEGNRPEAVEPRIDHMNDLYMERTGQLIEESVRTINYSSVFQITGSPQFNSDGLVEFRCKMNDPPPANFTQPEEKEGESTTEVNNYYLKKFKVDGIDDLEFTVRDVYKVKEKMV